MQQGKHIDIAHLERLHEIGIALSSERNLPSLLEMIVDEARLLTNADAGTLYIADLDKKCLNFAIVQCASMNVKMGGTSGAITWPPISLYKQDGSVNHANVSSYVALTGKVVNIADVYEVEGFDFSGTKKFDAGTGYRSKSMLVIPMKNRDAEIIGVLQLINAIDPQSKQVIAFHDTHISAVASLASQAAVAITNANLYRELEELLDAFIKSIASAIDEKSPYTAGHVRRVQALTMLIAEAMNSETEGYFADFKLSPDELKELSMSAWLHDTGKIVTPEHVVDKSTKLQTIYDRINTVSLKFELMKKDTEIKYLRDAIAKHNTPFDDTELQNALRQIDEAKDFVSSCNNPGEFMDDQRISRLHEIANMQCLEGMPCLTEDELTNLSIKKGSLTDKERKIIENHVAVTYKMLSTLPFPKKLKNVPIYASLHHEKLDGKGYPFGYSEEQIPIPARIIAVADIFEALTAKDRPYKKPMTVSTALKIMQSMKKDKHIDPEIVDLFIKRRLYEKYAKEELLPEQLDC